LKGLGVRSPRKVLGRPNAGMKPREWTKEKFVAAVTTKHSGDGTEGPHQKIYHKISTATENEGMNLQRDSYFGERLGV